MYVISVTWIHLKGQDLFSDHFRSSLGVTFWSHARPLHQALHANLMSYDHFIKSLDFQIDDIRVLVD